MFYLYIYNFVLIGLLFRRKMFKEKIRMIMRNKTRIFFLLQEPILRIGLLLSLWGTFVFICLFFDFFNSILIYINQEIDYTIFPNELKNEQALNNIQQNNFFNNDTIAYLTTNTAEDKTKLNFLYANLIFKTIILPIIFIKQMHQIFKNMQFACQYINTKITINLIILLFFWLLNFIIDDEFNKFIEIITIYFCNNELENAASQDHFLNTIIDNNIFQIKKFIFFLQIQIIFILLIYAKNWATYKTILKYSFIFIYFYLFFQITAISILTQITFALVVTIKLPLIIFWLEHYIKIIRKIHYYIKLKL